MSAMKSITTTENNNLIKHEYEIIKGCGCLDDIDGAARGYWKTLVLEVPILKEVFAQRIGVDEDAYNARHG